MSLNNDKFPVREPGGVYDFEVVPPPGWLISSGNPKQSVRFLPLQGSVAGIYAEKPPHWVGLMPELLISGRVIGVGDAPLPADVSITLTGPGGDSVTTGLANNGDFSVPVTQGDWTVVFASAASDWRLVRTVTVNNAPVEMVTLRVGDALPAPQPRPVLEHFDWLSRSVIDKLPNGHLGLNWDYLLAVHNQEYAGPGYVNGLTSGHAVAYNSSGHPVTVTAPAGQVFDFVGGYFSVAWNNAHEEVLELEAFRDGERVARHETTLSYLGPIWLDAELRGIDKLVLTTRHYWQFVADDLMFRVQGE
ncbi:MAG: carboxypeptidase regulatory-like domain-containing protein [Halioglobus sp.]|nr:carboxypeptidase regulatory-like domain-containing protein [Halioglobus sp.]